MNILITGGAGMIGANLSRNLLNKGFEVVVLDDLSSGFDFNLDPRATFIQGDISNKKDLQTLFADQRFDYIFHLAALFANQNSVEHPEQDLTVNGLGTLLLLQEVLKQHKKYLIQRFIYASSSCVYGMFNGIASEDTKFNLETPYAITKLLGEQYTKYFGQMYGLPCTCFRFFNSYGPGEMPGKYRNVIPNFTKLALEGQPLNITGTGNETRDFTFIDDTVQGIMLGMDSKIAVGKTYNIATGRETTIKDLAEKIIHYTNSSSPIVYTARRDWDHTTKRCGSIDLISKELGYNPSTSLEKGLQQTIAWLKSQNI